MAKPAEVGGARSPASAPDSLPIGVRAPATMTEPAMVSTPWCGWLGTVEA